MAKFRIVPVLFMIFLPVFWALIAGRVVYLVTHPAKPTGIATIIPAPTSATKQPPTSVSIPKIHSQLPIQAAVVNGNSWQLFNNAVAWMATSALPGQGNVVLYAHDTLPLWGNLYKLQPGDTVEVFQQQVRTTYVVTETRAVGPNEVSAIVSSSNQLTMFTCEGYFDQQRRVVYAKPEKLITDNTSSL